MAAHLPYLIYKLYAILQTTKHFLSLTAEVCPVCICHSVPGMTEEITIACFISSALCLTNSISNASLPSLKADGSATLLAPSYSTGDDLPPLCHHYTQDTPLQLNP